MYGKQKQKMVLKTRDVGHCRARIPAAGTSKLIPRSAPADAGELRPQHREGRVGPADAPAEQVVPGGGAAGTWGAEDWTGRRRETAERWWRVPGRKPAKLRTG